MKGLKGHINRSNMDRALELIQNEADINEKYGVGIRPIISAINSGDKERLEFVIRNGADLDIDDGQPLYQAIDIAIDGMIQDELPKPSDESMKIIQILLDSGADLEIMNEKGKRPIDIIPLYAHNDRTFELLKSFFRPLIPDIDKLIKRNESVERYAALRK